MMAFLKKVLIDGRRNESRHFLIGGELRHSLHHPLHDFDVTLAEGCHQARNFAVVLMGQLIIQLELYEKENQENV